MVKKDKVSVVLVCKDEKEDLSICLEHLQKLEQIDQIVVADRASQDGTSEWLHQIGIDSILFEESEDKYGLIWNAVLNNFSLAEKIIFAAPQYVIDANNLERLLEMAEPSGITGVMSNGFYYPQYAKEPIEELLENKCALGVETGFFAITRSCIEANGRFNEKLRKAGNVLLEYEMRMIKNGKIPQICTQAYVFDRSQGQKSTTIKDKQDVEDRKILKNLFQMNYFNITPNSNLADLVTTDTERTCKVLEIGCDLAATLLEIKNRNRAFEIYGVEINENAVELAKYVANVKYGNIEKLEIPFDEKFDYIIFGDVLEHLHNTEKVIEFCKSILNPDGYIVASIPNIMHISVMKQLINGMFQYEDMGLLDRTHIHFFTYYEIAKMFLNQGFEMEEIRTTSVVIGDEDEKLIQDLLALSNNTEDHMYRTYQYLVKAKIV